MEPGVAIIAFLCSLVPRICGGAPTASVFMFSCMECSAALQHGGFLKEKKKTFMVAICVQSEE